AATFGFDYLRDRLKFKQESGPVLPFWAPWASHPQAKSAAIDPRVQRPHFFALVDEADNIFIDEARTPLVISTLGRRASQDEAAIFVWADKLARQMQSGRDFIHDEKKHEFTMTEDGLLKMRWSSPPSGPDQEDMETLYNRLDKALHAHHRLKR